MWTALSKWKADAPTANKLAPVYVGFIENQVIKVTLNKINIQIETNLVNLDFKNKKCVNIELYDAIAVNSRKWLYKLTLETKFSKNSKTKTNNGWINIKLILNSSPKYPWNIFEIKESSFVP